MNDLVTKIFSTRTGNGKGKLFTVTFIKKDGTLRTMRARLGMRRNLTGKGLAFNPASKGLLPVWSADSQGYRMIPTDDRLRSLSIRDPRTHKRTTYYAQ